MSDKHPIAEYTYDKDQGLIIPPSPVPVTPPDPYHILKDNTEAPFELPDVTWRVDAGGYTINTFSKKKIDVEYILKQRGIEYLLSIYEDRISLKLQPSDTSNEKIYYDKITQKAMNILRIIAKSGNQIPLYQSHAKKTTYQTNICNRYTFHTTQKAKGLLASNIFNDFSLTIMTLDEAFSFPFNLPPFVPWETLKKVHAKKFKINGEKLDIFGRPCPVTPRHGFVESKVISSWEELYGMINKASSADPYAEVLLLPRFSAEYSMILNNGGLVIGKGHDGVTSGTDPDYVNLPFFVDKQEWYNILNESGREMYDREFDLKKMFGITDTAYIELVTDDMKEENRKENLNVKMVQLRDGPAQNGLSYFIPRKEKVTKWIHNAPIDLLEWEKSIKKLLKDNKGPKGLAYVTDLPLSSHYAVHAIQNGIAVVPTSMYKEGLELSPPENAIRNSLSKRHLKMIAGYMEGYLKEKPNQLTKALANMVLGTIHGMPFLGNDGVFLKLRGFGIVNMLHIQHATIMGELRYINTEGPGRYASSHKLLSSNPIPFFENKTSCLSSSTDRNVIYQLVKDFDLDVMLKSLEAAKKIYRGNWSKSFGGDAWAQVTKHTIILLKGIKAFLKNPTPLNWKKVVMAANLSLHTSHNNGAAITKITPMMWMDLIAKAPAFGFVSLQAAQFLRDGK